MHTDFQHFKLYFPYVCGVLAVVILTVFYILGRRALKQFPKLEPGEILYSEGGASGYSTQSFATRYGGASKTLIILITKDELWIKTYILFAGIAEYCDMLHKIPLSGILEIRQEQRTFFSKLHISFLKDGSKNEIVLISKNNKKIEAILRERTSI